MPFSTALRLRALGAVQRRRRFYRRYQRFYRRTPLRHSMGSTYTMGRAYRAYRRNRVRLGLRY